MRVDERGPLPRVGGDAARVQLTGPDDHLGDLAVDDVAVDVEVVEHVVPALGLETLVGVVDHARVEEPDVPDRLLVADDVVAGQLGGVVERLAFDLVQAHRVAGGLDVAFDVLGLTARLGRLDLEPLDDGRVDPRHDDGREAPQPHGHHRQHPPPAPDVHDEETRGEDRDEQQQVQRGELRLHVGVERTVDGAPRGERELVAVEPVPHRPDEGHDREQHREVPLHRRGGPLAHGAHPDAAVEVVGRRGDEEDRDERPEQPVHDERQERQLEDVEADVGVEEGVGHPPLLPVREEDPRLPLARRPDAGDEREHRRHGDAHEPAALADRVVVALEQLLLGPHRPEAGRHPVGEPQVHPHQDEEDRHEDEREGSAGAEDATPDRGEVEGVEPQVVGVEPGDAPQRGEEDDEGDERDDEDDSRPVRR